MVQFIADDRVFLAQECLEEPAVGVKTARIENAVIDAQERAQRRLELLVHGLGPADEAHRGHAEAPLLERRLCGLHQPWIVGEAQIIIRAKIEHAVGAVDSNFR